MIDKEKATFIKIEKLVAPYRSIDVVVLPEQTQYIDPTEKALSIMKDGEVPFVIRGENCDVGFFTLRASVNDEVEQLRGADRCTLLSFMIDARHQGKGYAGRALAELPALAAETFERVVSIGLTVNCRNEAAYRLYKKNGFEDTGELYLGGSAGPQHIMVMRLSAD